jgi:hypothetical protein
MVKKVDDSKQAPNAGNSAIKPADAAGQGKAPATNGKAAPANPKAAASHASRPDPGMFEDKRTGKDRRLLVMRQVMNSRREAGERRRAVMKQSTWWLQRDYVESHHFVQKSSRSRDRSSDDD